jgi:hypothetical protein
MKLFGYLLILLFAFCSFHFSLAHHYGWTDISGKLPGYPSDTAITGMLFIPGSDSGYVCCYMSSNLQQITPDAVNTISLGNTGWWKSFSAPSNDLIWISDGTAVWTFDEDGLTDQPVASTAYNSIDFERNNLGWGVGHDGVKERNPGTISGCIGKDILLKYCPADGVAESDIAGCPAEVYFVRIGFDKQFIV